nr:ejaculatory bulb-specific protein 3 [Helicoverpa armigera]
MRTFVVACLLGLVAVTLARPESKYTSKYDNINLDEILANQRLLVPYLKCILEEGKCTPEGKELKSHIREALEEDCAKCTENQRKGTRKVLAHLINHEEGYWNRLKAKYDPESKYTAKHEQELRELKH